MGSMKDVANLAGVSISTVSRVLNKHYRVDDATRQKVEEAIRTINYRPNLMAQGLRSKVSNIIGLVVPHLMNESFMFFVNHIEKYARERGYILVIGNTEDQAETEERFIDSLIRRHVDGIIFSRVSDKSRVLRLIDSANIPVVSIDRILEQEEIAAVTLDNRKAGRMAAEYLIGLGHRDIATVTGPLDIGLCRDRYLGFCEGLAAQGVRFDQDRLFEGTFYFESGIAAVSHFWNQKKFPTAIFAQNDLMALGVMKELLQRGIKIPQQVSVMGFDNIPASSMIVPALSTIAQPYEDMARVAVDLLVNDGGQTPKRHVKFDPSLVIRETTAGPGPEQGSRTHKGEARHEN